ncbi:MAG: hypothetical protein NZ888_06075 [Candidatus Nitrosocaldus sp.]|nr:hypothetical protein [Candidatus Nitrosocaldus sp.]MDW8000815.1 hypothetical protein [Candidatus Nitrosocaldus sp.]
MFKAPSENPPDRHRLVCMVCNHSIDLPRHHDRPMVWMLEGKFRKKEYLVCAVCGLKVDVPLHCGRPMLYTSSGYRGVMERYGE